VTACASCGRDNEAGARFCMDCGTPMGKTAARQAAAGEAGGGRPVAVPGTHTMRAPAAAWGDVAPSLVAHPRLRFGDHRLRIELSA
jgi:hypothetical protein